MTPTPPGARSAEEQARLERAIAELFEHLIPFNRVLGIQVLSTATGDARVRFDMKPELVGHPGFGRLHGGVIAAVLDALAGLGRCAARRHAARPAGRRRAGHIDIFKAQFAQVVHITSLGVQRDLFSMNVQQVPRGTGTGFVWDAQGHIVTNFHVIQGANGAKVTLADQSTYDARWSAPSPTATWRCCASRRRRTSCRPSRWAAAATCWWASASTPSATPSGWTRR
jgi:S1-C subfamily serine protease